MIKFEKVSYEQFEKDAMVCNPLLNVDYIKECYNNIKLPKRATAGSAGYDFFTPFSLMVKKGSGSESTDYVVVPTGIRWVTDRDDVVLMIYPRSGLGFKHNMTLANTTGVIDASYAGSSNEGHIMVKFSAHLKDIDLEEGKAFIQGVILPYLTVTDEEEVTTVRDGGFGSTDGTKGA